MRMRLVALAVALGFAACSRSPSPRHFGYPIHPRARSAAGGPIQIEGGVKHPGPIPYFPELTMTCALRLVGGETAVATGDALLRRDGLRYQVSLRRILDDAAPDLELAPGDQITVLTVEE